MQQPPKWLKKIQQAQQSFWEEQYANYSEQEKLDYWQKVLEKAMKEQKKQDLPEFGAFGAEWYASLKEQEPTIEELLQQLFVTVWQELPAEEFWIQIQKKEGNDQPKVD